MNSAAACRRGLRIEPRVPETLSSGGPLLRDEFQHRQQEVCEAGSLLLGPLILLYQNLQEAPRLQLGDVFQVTCGDSTRVTQSKALWCAPAPPSEQLAPSSKWCVLTSQRFAHKKPTA